VLVHSGAPIGEMNAIRKHLSAVKGGRLAQTAYPAQQVSILVSDVPSHSLDALASGPTMPDSSTNSDCYEIAEQYELLDRFPGSVRDLFAERALEETPKKDDPAFVGSRWWTVLSSDTAANAAATFAGSSGFTTEIDNSCDDWEYQRAADYLLNRLRTLKQRVSRGCVISAGEVTVRVDRQGGQGGRNQQFALYCAQKIAGENIAILSAGTDGIDGNSDAAGAVVDGSTVQRATVAALDPQALLSSFNSTVFFKSLGDAIVTGPTGNNVRDLRVLLAW
jgi:hydroxypyruvate reductase